MDSLLSIKKKLRPLNLYNLDDQNIINAEISAYAVAFDMINDEIASLEDECLISTAKSYGLDLREKLFDYIRIGLSNEKRREMLIYRKSITSNNFTKNKLEESLISSGIEAKITEDFDNNTIAVNCTDIFDTFKTQEDAKKAAEEFLPAHLEVTFNFSTESA